MFIANTFWIIEKAKEFQKKSTSASLSMSKPVTVWITTKCGKFFFFFLIGKMDFYFKIVNWNLFIHELSFFFFFFFSFFKEMEYQINFPVSWETDMWVKKKHYDWFKIGKGVWQSYILSPCLFYLYAEYLV